MDELYAEAADELEEWRKRIRVERAIKPWQKDVVLRHETRRVKSMARRVCQDPVVAVRFVDWHVGDVRRRLGLEPLGGLGGLPEGGPGRGSGPGVGLLDLSFRLWGPLAFYWKTPEPRVTPAVARLMATFPETLEPAGSEVPAPLEPQDGWHSGGQTAPPAVRRGGETL